MINDIVVVGDQTTASRCQRRVRSDGVPVVGGVCQRFEHRRGHSSVADRGIAHRDIRIGETTRQHAASRVGAGRGAAQRRVRKTSPPTSAAAV